jgi:ribosomal protein L11 methyltransferase
MTQLEKYITDTSVVADLGCGSGILSIIALLLGAKSAFAVDIDANAVKTAYENADLNGVDKTNYYVTSGNVINDEKLQAEMGFEKYDVVVANIIADVICAISPLVPRLLKSDGIFISSGIIKERVQDVYDAFEANGLEVVETLYKDEWVSITGRRKR